MQVKLKLICSEWIGGDLLSDYDKLAFYNAYFCVDSTILTSRTEQSMSDYTDEVE